MKFITKEHPVYCVHEWQHGQFPGTNKDNPNINMLVTGYLCQRCRTIWQTQTVAGVITPVVAEPKIKIGICEIEIPVLTQEPKQ